ncbi:MAG TPA: hypothetical protein VFZ09_25900 [Archangium sp.]|uniref:InlB B-repeat-containing protein n=1 Tax=Archangium sp. TaxID=1872627 RepID=UPI002E31DA93|nr:hypothetical protein [Archangium sp.]HEX5749691.1 hypothetical protein [Archangium sp.]
MRNRRSISAWGAVALGLLLVSSASAAPAWNYGVFDDAWHYACVTGNYEVLTKAQAGYYGDSSTPKVGDVYYVTARLAVIGNACSGGAQVSPELLLPPQTVLAISTQNPVRCVYTEISTGAQSELPRSECPQTPYLGPNGGHVFYQPQNTTFPVPYGKMFELWVPLLSKKTLSGSSTNEYFRAAIKVITDSTYTQFPRIGVFVFPNPPAISYPSPSTLTLGDTTARTAGRLWNHYTQGNAYADLGTSTSYGLPGKGPFAIGDHDWADINIDWSGLSPGTTYQWRLRFVSSTGVTTFGANQTFTTTGSATASYPLAISVTSGGSVNVSPNLASYPAGSTITLTAIPDTGSRFSAWTVDGVPAGSGNPLVHTVTQAHLIKATFSTVPPGTDGGTGPAPDGGTGPAPDGGTGPAPDGGSGSPRDGGTGGGGGVAPDEGTGGCGCGSSPGSGAVLALILLGGLFRGSRRET